MKKTIDFLLEKYLIIVFFIQALLYRGWIFSTGPITQGDWLFHTDSALETIRANYFNAWYPDGLGKVSIDLSQALSYSLYGYVYQLFDLSYWFSERLIHIAPILIITPVGIALVLRKYYDLNNFHKLIVVTFYCFNTYFLILSSGHLTLMAGFAFGPFLFYYIKNLTNKYSHADLSKFLVFSTICISYEIRAFYVSMIPVAIYLLFEFLTNRKTLQVVSFTRIGLGLLLLVFLNLFWILPVFLSGSLNNNEILGRSLFGDQFWSLKYAITLKHPFWSINGPETFIAQPIEPIRYIFIASLLFFVVSIQGKKLNKQSLYLISLFIVGIFLVKQSDAPFGEFYNWAYLNIPGFSAFREASKFYYLVALSTALLLAHLLGQKLGTKFYKYGTYSVTTLAIIITVINIIPLVKGPGFDLLIPKSRPSSYVKLEQILKSEGFYRTFWIPKNSRWADYNFTHPRVDAIKIVDDFQQSQQGSTLYSQIYSLVQSSLIKPNLENSSVKYVIVPSLDIENKEDLFFDYGHDRKKYVQALDSMKWLEKVNIGEDSLDVYENKNYKPFFSSDDKLKQIDSLRSLDTYFEFNKNQLNDDSLNFYEKTSDHEPIEHITYQKDLFEEINLGNLKEGYLFKSIKLSKDHTNTLYYDHGSPFYTFELNQNSIVFRNTQENFLELNDQQIERTKESIISSTILENKKYGVSIGEQFIDIDAQNQKRVIGTTHNPIKLYSFETENLIDNSSFEDGLWQETVGDCNNFDDSSNLTHQIDKGRFVDGEQSLKLGAYRHTSCTNSNAIKITGNQVYNFSYKYFLDGGQRAGYDLVFDDINNTVISSDQTNISGSWNSINIIFKAPAGATEVKIKLKGYPDDRNKTYALTNYDELSLKKIRLEANVAEEYTPSYMNLELNNGTSSQFKVDNDNYDFSNLIMNPSFEDGLWQETVGDCNNFDDQPKLGMNLSNESIEGDRSLELTASRHIACTNSEAIEVKEGSSYRLSFNFQSPNANQAGYYISFNDPDNTNTSERLNINGTDWHDFNTTITAPFGATKMNITVYGYSDEFSNDNNINRYDNFSLFEIPNLMNRYYLTSEPKEKLVEPKDITFDLDSPAKKRVYVKGATTGFYLNMSESYHPKWRLELNDEKVAGLSSWLPNAKPTSISEDNHFELNGFLNSWYVDPEELCKDGSSACIKNADGSYDIEMVVEFTPQRYFYIGLIISGLTLLGVLSYLIISHIKGRKDFKGWRYYGLRK